MVSIHSLCVLEAIESVYRLDCFIMYYVNAYKITRKALNPLKYIVKAIEVIYTDHACNLLTGDTIVCSNISFHGLQ